MKVYLKHSMDLNRPRYLERMQSGIWTLIQEEPHDFDWKVRVLNEFESNFVESVFQHFAEPMKKLMGE